MRFQNAPQAEGRNRQVIVDLGSIECRTPLNFIRNAEKAICRGIAEPDLASGITVASMLMFMALDVTKRSGSWGAPRPDIRAAVLKLRQSSLEMEKIGGEVADLNGQFMALCDSTLELVGVENAG